MTTHLRRCTEKQKNHSEIRNLEYLLNTNVVKYINNNRKVKMNTKSVKNKTISLRLTEALFTELSFKSSLLNIDNSDFLRQCITNTVINAKLDTKELASLISTLTKIGHDISKIATVLNVSNLEDSLEDIEYENLLNQLILIREQLRELLCLQK